jgi:hypothetical protein
MFVRAKGLTAIVDKGHDALAVHPQFVAWQGVDGETELRATVNWPGDEHRRANLHVFFLHTPA